MNQIDQSKLVRTSELTLPVELQTTEPGKEKILLENEKVKSEKFNLHKAVQGAWGLWQEDAMAPSLRTDSGKLIWALVFLMGVAFFVTSLLVPDHFIRFMPF